MTGEELLKGIAVSFIIFQHFRLSFAVIKGVDETMVDSGINSIINSKYFVNFQHPSADFVLRKDKKSNGADSSSNAYSLLPSEKSDNFVNDTAHAAGMNRVIENDHSNAAASTKDTIVVLVTLTVIFLTLIVSYFLWRKRRSSFSATQCNRLEEYRYSRLSQNDVEVDNISFQGDLTHKPLVNTVPVCAEEDGDDHDDQVRPATLRLEYDSLITISNDEHQGKSGTTRNSTSATADDTPVNLLIDELSDEDLLQ